MKKIILAAALLLTSTTAHAGFYTSTELYDDCTFGGSRCLAYVMGVADADRSLHKCFSENVSAKHLAAVVYKHFRDHPEDLRFQPASVVMYALDKAYCK